MKYLPIFGNYVGPRREWEKPETKGMKFQLHEE